MAIRLLHFSDLHACGGDRFSQHILLDELVRDVEAQHRARPASLIFFTGDLAFAGKPAEFQTGADLLLTRVMDVTGLDAARVVLVPGNHDVDRSGVDATYEAGLAARLTNHDAVVAAMEDAALIAHAQERLAAWADFTDRFYAGVEREALVPGAWTRRLQIDGIEIGIAALNSAWRSTGAGEQERGQLLVGDMQVRTATERIAHCALRLVAVHHPLDWLIQFDRKAIEIELQRAAPIILSGHEHEADPRHLINGSGSAIYSRAGCLYSGLAFANAYTAIDIDPTSRQVRLEVRQWQPARTFTTASTLDLTLPQTSAAMVAVTHSDVSAALVEVVQRTRIAPEHLPDHKYSSVTELLLPPHLYPAPFAELAAATVQRGELQVEQADVDAVMAGHRVVVVVGDPESGVTGSLAWLLDRRHAADPALPAIYTKFDRRAGLRVIDESIRSGAAKLGWNIDKNSASPPILLGIDDVNGLSAKPLARLARHIAEHAEHRYVIGCHSEHSRAVMCAITEAEPNATRLFVGPINRPSEVRALVYKLVRSPSKSLADKVWTVLSDSRLPRTPFMTAALTAVLYSGPDARALDPTAVVDRYIDLQLGRTDILFIGADFRQLEHLLEHIAGRFTELGIDTAPRGDVESWIGAYLGSLGDNKTSPGRRLEGYIERRLLIDIEGEVTFRHPVLQHVMAARLMREPDQTEFAARIRGDVIGYREIVRHAAALQRNDRDLLLEVARVTTQALADALGGNPPPDLLAVFGSAEEMDPAQLAFKLQATAPKPPEVIEAELDQLYERMGTLSAARQRAASEPSGLRSVLASVSLLSSVVTTSELVTDKAIRAEFLKVAIGGWGVGAVEILKQEEATGEIAELFRRTILNELTDEQATEITTPLVRLGVMIGLMMTLASSLVQRQIDPLLAEALADDEFMSIATNATFAVWIAALVKLQGWPNELRKLHKRHGQLTFVHELAISSAMSAYQSPFTSDEDATALEAVIQEILGGRIKGDIGLRQFKTAEVAGQLRLRRAQAKITHGTGPTACDGTVGSDESSAASA